MKYADIIKFYENKNTYIDRNSNLTDEQKEEVKEFFKIHPEQESKIPSNMWMAKTTEAMPKYADFKQIILDFNKRYLPKWTLKDLKEGKDYVFITEDSINNYYFIKTYKASVAFASNNIGPEVWCSLPDWYADAEGFSKNVIKDYEESTNPKYLFDDPKERIYSGAKWCISMNHTSTYWEEYSDLGYYFVFGMCKESQSSMYKHRDSEFNKTAYAIKNGVVENYYNAYDEETSAEEAEEYWYDYETKPFDFLFKGTSLLDEIEKEKEHRLLIAKQQAQEINKWKESLPQMIIPYEGKSLPFIQMGTRAEGKVFGSTVCLNERINYFLGEYAEDINSNWKDSTIRQWLNSDEPNGKWWKPERAHAYCDRELKNNPPRIDGFLRILGIDKSQLNAVVNKTYTGEEFEITEDYVWIPSLVELGYKPSSGSVEENGEPLEYWKKIKSNYSESVFKQEFGCSTINSRDNVSYWTRTRSSYSSRTAMCYVPPIGDIGFKETRESAYIRILLCPKDSLIEKFS